MSISIDDLRIVYKTTFEARNKWQNILLELEMSSATIESISVRCRDNPDNCYREGLTEWLKGGERSWKELAEALSSPTVGHYDIAKAIDRDHNQSTGTTTIPTRESQPQRQREQMKCPFYYEFLKFYCR